MKKDMKKSSLEYSPQKNWQIPPSIQWQIKEKPHGLPVSANLMPPHLGKAEQKIHNDSQTPLLIPLIKKALSKQTWLFIYFIQGSSSTINPHPSA